MSTVSQIQDDTSEHSWSGVYAIAFGAFSLVMTEFFPVGLLPGISRDLGISEGTTGFTVAVTAILGFFAAPATAMIIKTLDRRIVLLALTGLLVISSGLSAIASSFPMLLVARIILGIAIGGFWATSLPAAAKLVPRNKVHAASSIVLGGISVGSVIAVPAGSYIGANYDWHIAFTAATALAVITFLMQLLLLPSLTIKERVSASHFFGLLRSPRVLAILLTVIFFVGGHFAAYTFITPYFEQVTKVSSEYLSVLLVFYGLVTVAGNFVGGAMAGWRLHLTVLITAILFAVSLFGFAIFGANVIAASISAMIWALAWGMAPVGTQLWLFENTQKTPEAAQAMNTSIFQLSISLGSFVGGVAVNSLNLNSAIWLGAIILAASIVVVFAAGRLKHRDGSKH